MEYTNGQMKAMLRQLEPHLPRIDLIGYAAARNTRVLRDELSEYLTFEDKLLRKYGEPEKDEDGNPTGRVALAITSPSFKDFMDEIKPLSEVRHEPELFKLAYEQAIGQLSGSDLLELDWMFEEVD